MKIQESGENYLETILMLQNQNGSVRSIDIANELGYSKPSISRAVNILKTAGYINMQDNGHITLTDSGERKAKEVYERHQVITRFLTETLGVDDKTAEEDACRIEHVISCETFQKMKEYMEKN